MIELIGVLTPTHVQHLHTHLPSPLLSSFYIISHALSSTTIPINSCFLSQSNATPPHISLLSFSATWLQSQTTSAYVYSPALVYNCWQASKIWLTEKIWVWAWAWVFLKIAILCSSILCLRCSHLLLILLNLHVITPSLLQVCFLSFCFPAWCPVSDLHLIFLPPSFLCSLSRETNRV